jgi:hypothetical protein
MRISALSSLSFQYPPWIYVILISIYCSDCSRALAARPWWEEVHVSSQSRRGWQIVDPDFNWNRRQTGVTKEWKAFIAQWNHYNASALEHSSIKPEPWTSGYMCKSLRQLNESAFQLRSVYESNATGLWAAGMMQERSVDDLLEHGHIFTQTPYRITTLPGIQLPPDLDLPEGVDTSRVTIVQPDSATFSGPRWLPTQKIAKQLLEVANNPLSQAPGKQYNRWQFCEMWLTETIDAKPEARKMGLFCQYNGVTGELEQIFRMREVVLPSDLSPASPDSSIPMTRIQHALTDRNYAPWTDARHLESTAAQSLFAGQSIPNVLKQGDFKSFSARVVHTKDGPAGPEHAFKVENAPADQYHYYSPADAQHYWDCRWEDGVYARIPKSFYPQSVDSDTTELCMEFGCITMAGGFHRLLATGSRDTGGLYTTVYERWSK